jgi:hypothetical protein
MANINIRLSSFKIMDELRRLTLEQKVWMITLSRVIRSRGIDTENAIRKTSQPKTLQEQAS